MSDWWERRKKRRYPGFGPFGNMDQFFRDLDEFMRREFEGAFKTPKIEKGEMKVYGPYVYGFSYTMGPDGKPIIREFGNVKPTRLGPRLREEREPLVDVMSEKDEVVVTAELPGVEKTDIKLDVAEETLTISVDTKKHKYHKELELPSKVDSKSAKASYKNGVLEVRLRKRAGKPTGKRIPIE